MLTKLIRICTIYKEKKSNKATRNTNKKTNKVSSYHGFQNHNRSNQHRCSVKELFLKTLQISQEIGVFFNKVAGLKAFFKTWRLLLS